MFYVKDIDKDNDRYTLVDCFTGQSGVISYDELVNSNNFKDTVGVTNNKIVKIDEVLSQVVAKHKITGTNIRFKFDMFGRIALVDFESNLKTFKVPDFVFLLGKDCFSHNDVIEEVSFSDTSALGMIEDSCFEGCSALKCIHLPDSVYYIGKWCFTECSSLTDIHLSEHLHSLLGICFGNCSSLRSIYIPDAVTELQMGCFSRCDNLREISVSKDLYETCMATWNVSDSKKLVSRSN